MIPNSYPKKHLEFEVLEKRHGYQLEAKHPWVEFPIVNPRKGHGWTTRQKPGPVRAIYNNSDRKEFNVVYHDPKAGKHGKYDKFSMATYRPATRPKITKPKAANGSRTYTPRRAPFGKGRSVWQVVVRGSRPPPVCNVGCLWQRRTVSVVREVM